MSLRPGPPEYKLAADVTGLCLDLSHLTLIPRALTMTPFEEHFAIHAASSHARQMALADYLGDRHWGLDARAGILRFGDDLRFRVQMLGTRADHNDSWMWSWANEESGLPSAVTALASALRQFGEEHGIEEFTEPFYVLREGLTGHMLAMACSGVAGGKCYYRAPYEGGALFMLLDDVPAHVTAPVAAQRAVFVLNDLISHFEVDNRMLAINFLRQQAFSVDEAPGQVTAARPDGSALQIHFDSLGRIAWTEATVRPTPPASAPPRPWWKVWG